MIGWSVADIMLPDQEPNYVVLGAGLGLTIVSSIFGNIASNRASKACRIYNESIAPPSTAHHFDVNFQFSRLGAGLKVSF